MDVARYLARIGIEIASEPTLENLERLQRAHLGSVPFENLDVFHRRGVKTSEDWSVPKIVERRRGGWCFELNGAFAALLTELGYQVRRLAATVLLDEPVTPIPTHLTLEVTLDRPYLVDVGFGDSFMRPLPVDDPGPHDGGDADYGFLFDNGQITLVRIEDDGSEAAQYRFDRTPRTHTDFEEASQLLQTEPGLQWTTSRFATRLIGDGPDRVILLEDRIRFRKAGQWTEDPVTAEEWPGLLDQWFGMTP